MLHRTAKTDRIYLGGRANMFQIKVVPLNKSIQFIIQFNLFNLQSIQLKVASQKQLEHMKSPSTPSISRSYCHAPRDASSRGLTTSADMIHHKK